MVFQADGDDDVDDNGSDGGTAGANNGNADASSPPQREQRRCRADAIAARLAPSLLELTPKVFQVCSNRWLVVVVLPPSEKMLAGAELGWGVGVREWCLDHRYVPPLGRVVP